MYRHNVDLAALAMLTVLITVAQLLEVSTAIRTFLAVPLVCCLTGYAVLAAALPNTRLGVVERGLLSIGLSLAIAILGGLLLNWVPGGVTPLSWQWLLNIILFVAIGIAAVHRSPDTSSALQVSSLQIKPLQFLPLCAALVIATGAIFIARQPSPPQGVDGYTLLWLVPTSGDPRSNEFYLGIHSDELFPVEYQLQLFAGNELIGEWPSIRLNSGEQWEVHHTLFPDQHAVNSVRALLFRHDALPWPPYRTVEIRR